MKKRVRGDQGAAGLDVIVAVIAVVVVIGLIFGAVELFNGFTSTDGGHVAVVRNGGSFNNTKIKEVIQPGSGRKFIGVTSTVHQYPANQRFYTIAADGSGDRNGVDVIQVPSSDGIELGIEGTIYFTLNLDTNTLKSFDNKYGTRTFTGNDGKQHHAYDGENGWNAFLDQVIRKVINNDLRISVGSYRCQDLLSSCALLYNANLSTGGATGGAANINLAKVEQQIGQSLQSDFDSSLGGNFLTGVRFNLNGVRLPTAVQDSINTGLSKVTAAQANLKAAQAEAQANETKQKGYNSCPVCGQIDLLGALPKGITVYAPGNSGGISLPTASGK